MIQRPALYVTPTPIGNMHDITLRALEVLRQVDFVVAEDAQAASRFLRAFSLPEKTAMTCDKYNEAKSAPIIVSQLKSGKCAALMCDAGTPLICDPGATLARGAIEAGIPVIALPGPAAFLTALVASGLTSQSGFAFRGFLPRSASAKRQAIAETSNMALPVVFYLTSRDVEITLAIINDLFADRRLALCQELTKPQETVLRGTAYELIAMPKSISGEFVLVLGAASPPAAQPPLPSPEILSMQLAELMKTRNRAESIQNLARRYRTSNRSLYRLLLEGDLP